MTSRPRRFPRVLVIVFATILSAVAQTGMAADLLREETSLGFIEDDVAVYASMLRNRAQIDRFLNSNAFAKLKAIPFYQMGVLQLQAQWNSSRGPIAEFRDILESEQGQEGLAVLQDAVSDEVFLAADQSIAQLFDILNEINHLNRTQQLQRLKGEGEEAEKAAREIGARFANMSKELEVPTLVMGFRLQNVERARRQLDVLEPLIRQGLESAPELASRLERTKIGDGELLTLTLSSDMIPWDKLLNDVDESLQDSVEQIRDNLRQKSIVVSIGVRGRYLLLSLSGSAQALELPSSPQLLIDRSELALLREHADKPMTGISYVSKEFMTAATRSQQQMNDMQEVVTAALREADMDEALRQQIINDVQEFSADIAKYMPDYGAVASFQFMTDDGLEGYTQNWTVPLGTDGSRELSILQHVGGQPLFLAAGRQKGSAEGYALLVKWFDRGVKYLETGKVREQLDDQGKEVWDTVAEHLPGLCERFDKITRESLIPALKDGQSALVLDARLASVKWHQAMPQASTALPLPEFSILCGVSDAGLMRKAFADYWTLAGDSVRHLQNLVRKYEDPIRDEMDDDQEAFLDMFLAYEWRFPSIDQTSTGEVFKFPFPEQLGLDPQLLPSLGIASDVMVTSISNKTVARLMQSESLDVGGALEDVHRPLAAAVYMDCEGMWEMLKPWLGYGVDLSAGESAGPILAMFEPQVLGVIEVLQCFKSYSSATTVEGDSLLTHQRWIYQDVE